MRLSPGELAALREALAGVDCDAVFLFGSRTDPARRGGDIDLLVRARGDAFALAHRISSRYAQIIDARLDVLVIDPDHSTVEQRQFIATLNLDPIDDLVRA